MRRGEEIEEEGGGESGERRGKEVRRWGEGRR